MNELEQIYNRFVDDNNDIRVANQKKRYEYYIGDKEAIFAYLEQTMDTCFDSDTTSEMISHFLNIVEKVIKRLSILYNRPAVRTIVVNGKPDLELTKYYNSILPDNINTVDKLALELARLDNVSLTQVKYNKKKKKMSYRVEPSFKFDVKSSEDDVNEMAMLCYSYMYPNPDGKDELRIVVWTEDEHYRIDSNGKKIAVGNNEGMVNPYKDKYGNGVIPYAVTRINEGDDFWGQGQDDLVNVNEIINIMLTDLLNSGVIMSSYGTPIATNLGLETKTESGDTVLNKVLIGMKHPFTVENVRNDMTAPSLTFAQPKSLLKEILSTIDWHIKAIAIMKGLDPNSMVMETKSTSGYSKIMDALGEMGIRENIVEPCRIAEKERFEITRAVNNYYANTEKNLQLIPLEAELKVNFSEVFIPKTEQELWLDREMKFKYNQESPYDWLIQDDKDLNEEEAMARFKKNSEINKSLDINEVKQAVNVPNTQPN